MTEEQHYNSVLGYPDDYSPQERAHDEKIAGIKKRYIGVDQPQVYFSPIERTHWTQLPKATHKYEPKEYGDNDKSDPENNWEEEN